MDKNRREEKAKEVMARRSRKEEGGMGWGWGGGGRSRKEGGGRKEGCGSTISESSTRSISAVFRKEDATSESRPKKTVTPAHVRPNDTSMKRQ